MRSPLPLLCRPLSSLDADSPLFLCTSHRQRQRERSEYFAIVCVYSRPPPPLLAYVCMVQCRIWRSVVMVFVLHSPSVERTSKPHLPNSLPTPTIKSSRDRPAMGQARQTWREKIPPLLLSPSLLTAQQTTHDVARVCYALLFLLPSSYPKSGALSLIALQKKKISFAMCSFLS